MSKNHVPAKVLYCESNADGTIGGSHYCLAYLVEKLDRSQFEPIVGFYEEHALIPRFRASAETVVFPQDAPMRWSEQAAGWRSLPLVLARRTVNFAKFLRTVSQHVSFLRRRGIALLHLNNSITRHQDWMLAAFIARVPCIVHERGLSEVYTLRDRAYARRVACIIPMSKWIRDHMVERGVPGKNIRVLYDGLEPSALTVKYPGHQLRETWGVRADQPVVGIVGNIRKWKGQETVVRALIAVVKEIPDVVCFFVGKATDDDKTYEDSLRHLIREAGIEPNVRFTGYQNDVPSFVKMMSFVIHASVEPEPFGMVVLEAMAQRKAVIGSRAGGVVEMVVEGETGYTYPPGDWQALASRMIELLGDPEKAKQMGEKGYERLMDKFTVQSYMNEIHATYRAVLTGRSVE